MNKYELAVVLNVKLEDEEREQDIPARNQEQGVSMRPHQHPVSIPRL